MHGGSLVGEHQHSEIHSLPLFHVPYNSVSMSVFLIVCLSFSLSYIDLCLSSVGLSLSPLLISVCLSVFVFLFLPSLSLSFSVCRSLSGLSTAFCLYVRSWTG